VTVEIAGQSATGMHIGLIDARTGAAGPSLELPDSLPRSVTALPDGWAWIPSSGDHVVVQRGGKTIEVPAPRWFESVFLVIADRTGRRLGMIGWNAATNDSLGVAVVPVDGGTPEFWGRAFAERGGASFLDDGSVLFAPWDTPESIQFSRLTGPGAATPVGRVPRSVGDVTFSGDLKRAAVLEVNRHGDAFMSKLVRR
jgi:hypothetical protein